MWSCLLAIDKKTFPFLDNVLLILFNKKSDNGIASVITDMQINKSIFLILFNLLTPPTKNNAFGIFLFWNFLIILLETSIPINF